MSVYIPGNMCDSEVMGRIFSDENQIAILMRIEGALARAQARLGYIPREDADVISAKASPAYLDLEIYHREFSATAGHHIVALLRAWEPALGQRAAGYVHWGASTQDLWDTREVLRLREAYHVIYGQLVDIAAILRELCGKHKRTAIAGRAHGVHAVPTTFGAKVAVWLRSLERQIQRMDECKKRLFVCSFYGGSGNLASLGEGGLRITEELAKELELGFEPVCWHTARDSFAEFISILANIAGTFGKMGNDLFVMANTEYGEVEEPWRHGNVSSSTMPHKRNPLGCEKIVALSRLAQHTAGAIFPAMVNEHERDSRAWNLEEFVLPQVCGLTEKLLSYARLVLKDLVVYPQRMRKNIDLTNGLIMSESLMMSLGRHIGRLRAHEVVYELAMDAYAKNIHLKTRALEEELITSHMSEEEILGCFEPTSYIGEACAMVDAALMPPPAKA